MKWISIAVICLITVGAFRAPQRLGRRSLPVSYRRQAATTRPDKSSADDKIIVTHHSLTLGGAKIDYQALAGTIMMKDDSGKAKANFFFVAYLKEPAASPADRPITFVFNGGPGAAAVFLHLGCVGPQRIALGPDGLPGVARFSCNRQ